MTERLYYHDPYLHEFDGTVAAIDRAGDRLEVVLDRTAFYPTSGGQPFDVGTLGGFRVLDVADRDHAVVHVLEAASGPPGSDLNVGQHIHGSINWDRRFDHMQQHTGQHVLSAAFDHLNARTVSFHLGTEACTIDLSRDLAAREIESAEDEANRVVWEDRPIDIRFVSAEEAASLPLRKESSREGTLRLIDIENCDLSACGGTHVSRTGAVGVIAVTSTERVKGGLRVEFVCGRRALSRFRSLRDLGSATVRLLSVLPGEVPGAIERMQADAKTQKRTLTDLQNELAAYRAAELTRQAEQTTAGRLVARSLDADANLLKSLASAVTASPGHIAVLVSSSRPALVVVARSSDVRMASNKIVADLIASFGGRGGGRPELAQAGGLDAAADTILAEARTNIVESR